MKRLLLALLLASALSLGGQNAPQDCWGSDKPCADGKYRDRFGKEQPESCDNQEHGSAPVHNCECNRTEEPDKCLPERPHESGNCAVYCRGDHCHCTNSCDD